MRIKPLKQIKLIKPSCYLLRYLIRRSPLTINSEMSPLRKVISSCSTSHRQKNI